VNHLEVDLLSYAADIDNVLNKIDHVKVPYSTKIDQLQKETTSHIITKPHHIVTKENDSTIVQGTT